VLGRVVDLRPEGSGHFYSELLGSEAGEPSPDHGVARVQLTGVGSPVLFITIMRKIKVWKWNRNLLLGASGPSAAAVARRSSKPLGMYPAGDVRVPSLARLSRYGAPVSEVVMVATVRAVGLRPIVTRLGSTRPEGTVLFTTPGSDVEVVPDSSVDIVVSDGKASRP
jgi:hypothetical protein